MAQLLSGENKVIVGIDFGTTYSGIAWAKIGDDLPNVIQNWPGIGTPSAEKVPTQICYDAQEATGIKWGYQIQSMARRYQWFKLALDKPDLIRTSSFAQRYSDGRAVSSDQTHTAEQLATDYLKALKRHLISTLARELGDAQAQKTPLEFVVTVPAVWSDLAKEKTLNAAKKAGLADNAPIHMISEPEAAAMYVLKRKELHNLAVGDTFVVCDAGGGTVDLISYTMVKLDPFIEVKEAAPGTGGLCGSTFINGRFKEYLQYRLGHEPGWDDEVEQDAMNDFELQVKRSYTSTAADTVYSISVPGLGYNAALGINKRGKLVLKSGDVKEMLEPIVAEVVKLVLEQIAATKKEVKSILLVGGFGGSQYLQERIRGAVNSNIEVIKPPYAWSAVVQGALIQGLARYDGKHAHVRLSSRVARQHLGIEVTTLFKNKLHLRSKRFWDDYTGTWQTVCMNWFIKKGDMITEDTPFKFHYFMRWLVSDGQQHEINVILYWDRTGRAPVLNRNYQVEQLVQLKADISTIPEGLLSKKMGADGQMYYHFDFDIEVTYLSASTKYELVHKGVRYGTVTAEYA